jgi:hypothetical protein
MDGKFNGFEMSGFWVRAGQSAYEDAIEATFNIDVDRLEWANDTFSTMSIGANYVSPQDILNARFAATQ